MRGAPSGSCVDLSTDQLARVSGANDWMRTMMPWWSPRILDGDVDQRISGPFSSQVNIEHVHVGDAQPKSPIVTDHLRTDVAARLDQLRRQAIPIARRVVRRH